MFPSPEFSTPLFFSLKFCTCCHIKSTFHLGGHFGPEKKYLAPPPTKFPGFPADTLPAPRPPPLSWENPPPPGIFNKKPTPAHSCRLGLPLPLPRAEKKIKIFEMSTKCASSEKSLRFLCVHSAEGTLNAASRRTPKLQDGALRDELKTGRGGVWAVYYGRPNFIHPHVRIPEMTLPCQKTFCYLWRFYSLLFRGFFVVFSWLFRGPLLSRKTVFGPFSLLFRGFFVAFPWLFRGPRFGQILRVLALEQSSDLGWGVRICK